MFLCLIGLRHDDLFYSKGTPSIKKEKTLTKYKGKESIMVKSATIIISMMYTQLLLSLN